MTKLFVRFLRDESGEGLSEVVLVTGVALLVVPTTGGIGTGLAAVFDKLTRAMQ